MLTHPRVEQLLNMYYVSTDPKYLHLLIDLTKSEIETPTLQKTMLLLDDLTEADVASTLQRQGYLTVSAQSCTNMIEFEGKLVGGTKAPIKEGMLIRVYPKEFNPEEDKTRCVLLQLAKDAGTELILVIPPPEKILMKVSIPTKVGEEIVPVDYPIEVNYGVKVQIPSTRYHTTLRVIEIKEEEGVVIAENDIMTLEVPLHSIKEVYDPGKTQEFMVLEKNALA